MGDLDQGLGHEGPGDGGGKGIDVLIETVGLYERPYVFLDELFSYIEKVGADRSVPVCAGDDLLAVCFRLSDIDGDGDDVYIVVLLEPVDVDGGVESSGVRQYDLVAFSFFVRFVLSHMLPHSLYYYNSLVLEERLITYLSGP